VKKILGLTIAILVVIGLVAGGTFAYFSDTETSENNQFTAGVIDLEVDCAGDTTFAATDDPIPVIFEYLPANDIKPGDAGEVTLSLHLKADSNNADLSIEITNLVDDGGLNPESEDPGDDVISDAIEVFLWVDMDDQTGTPGDNVYQAGETVLFDGTLFGLEAAGKLTVINNAEACTIYYIGFSWELPSSVGNEAQGDYCTFDIVFGADQIVP
jgi:spore coat-associated protein N